MEERLLSTLWMKWSRAYRKMLSFDRIKSLLGKLHNSVANFSTSPFCCNASHKHCTWSGLKSNCFLPKSILITLLPCPPTAGRFGDIPYECERFSFSRFAIGSIEWWSGKENATPIHNQLINMMVLKKSTNSKYILTEFGINWFSGRIHFLVICKCLQFLREK